MKVDVTAAPSQSLSDIGIRVLARQCSREDRMAKVAFLGLGVMGYPMAGHLKNKGGNDVTVYNRTAAKAQKWVGEYGGGSAATPKAAAEGQDLVMCCVGNDDDLREVTLGPNGASLPVSGLVDQFYAEVAKTGGRRWDTSSLIARRERCASEGSHSAAPACHNAI